MRRTDWHNDVVPELCVDVRVVGCVVAYGAGGGEEGLVVHFVPVGGWAGGVWGEGEFGYAEAVVWVVRNLLLQQG
jgi:hypothetical protein